MRYCAAAVFIGLCVGWVTVGQGDPAPTPKIVPTAWELDLTFENPKQMTLRLPGEKAPSTFWYLLFQVQNGSGSDHNFTPRFTLYTDTGEVMHSVGSPTAAFMAIQTRHNNPLLQNLPSVSGRLLQGEDNAKDGVAMWKDLPEDVRAFDLFIGGLSGEQETVQLPKPIVIEVVEDGKTKKITKDKMTLFKTLKLSYSIPGEAAGRSSNPPKLIKKSWVMR